MRTKPVLFLVLLIAGAASLQAHAQDNSDMRSRVVQQVRDRFAKADTNGDGALTRDEAKAMPRVASHFDEIDADHDGKVTLAEIGRYMAAQRGQ